MFLNETKTIDQIIISEFGTIQYREALRIIKDNNEISKTYHVTVLMPGQDLTNVPANVVAICNTVWTPQIINSYQAKTAQLIA